MFVTRKSIFRSFKRFILQFSNYQVPEFTLFITQSAVNSEPTLTSDVLPMLEPNFNDLLEAIKRVRVKEASKQTKAEKNDVQSIYVLIITELCYRYSRNTIHQLIGNAFLTFVFLCFVRVKLKDLMRFGVK